MRCCFIKQFLLKINNKAYFTYQLHLKEPRNVQEGGEGDHCHAVAGHAAASVAAESHVPVGVGPAHGAISGTIKLILS